MTMEAREKLVELLNKANSACVGTDCFEGCKFYMENDCLYKVMADVMIENGVTVQEWISIKDRLPDKRGEYLCYYKFEPDSPDVVCENTYQGSGLWLSEMDKVTHWQPMPQPPKGE